MVKKQEASEWSSGESPSSASHRPETIVVPEGFAGEEEVPDIEAYWDSASPDRNNPKTGEGPGAKYGHHPVIVTPLFVTLIDSDIDDTAPKSSTLIHCRLERAAVLRVAEKDSKEQREFPAGTIVGIWAKAGMKPLKKLANTRVFLANGQVVRGQMQFFKNLGKAGRSPMVLFTIRPEGPGEALTVKNDYRDESLPELQRMRKQLVEKRRAEAIESAPVDLDDIPF